MGFGSRSQTALPGTFRQTRSALARGRMIRTALAGLVLGFGGVTAGTSLVQASERGGLFDFFGQIFGRPPVQRQAEPPRAPKRYSSLPDARRVSSIRTRHFTPRPSPLAGGQPDVKPGRRVRGPVVTAAPVAPTTGQQTVCVRTCDGYLFPLGMLRAKQDLPVHRAACAAACPGAPTALFTLQPGQAELDQAVSLKGQPYLAAAWANVYRRKRVENCHCQPPGSAALPLPVAADPTVRVGDVVATADSASVVTRLARNGPILEDYRATRSLGRGARADIDRRVGSIRREADTKAFRRTLRTADADAARMRLAEARFTRMRADTAERDVGAVATGAKPSAAGFTPARVLVPAPHAP